MTPTNQIFTKLKVLFVIRSMQYGGGAERLLFDIFNEIKSRNIPVKIVVCEQVGPSVTDGKGFEKLLSDDPNVHFLNEQLNLSILGKNDVFSQKYKLIVDTFQPNIIHSHLFRGELLSRTYIPDNIQYFSHFHDNIEQLRNWKWSFFPKKRDITDFYEKQFLLKRYKKNNGTKFITISKSTYSYAKKVLPKTCQNNIHLLPNAVTLSRFSSLKVKNKSTKIKLLNVGSLIPRKNQKFLFTVVKEMKTRGLNVHLDCLGEGVCRKELEDEISKLGLQQEITLHGNQDVEKYLEEASVYVHVAKNEPFGLVLIEAMASKTPVVSLNGKGNSDIVIDRETGFLISEENTCDFADQIEQLAKNEKVYNSISSNAYEFAKQYDIKPYVDKLLDLYQTQ